MNFGNALHQKFQLEYQQEGYYKITVLHTGKSITIKDNEIKEGASIVQYDYQDLDSQKWILIDSKINGWIIAPLSAPNLGITIEELIQDESRLILKTIKKEDNQMFYLFNLSLDEGKKTNGIYKIAIGKDPNKVFNVLDGKKDNLINLNILDYNDTIQQKFYFEYQKEGFYKITSMKSGKSLMVKDNIIQENKEIVQYHYNGLDSQKWILRDSHIAGWVISPLSNPELAITVEGNIKNNSKLILDRVRDDDNQMLYLFNISKEEQKKKNGIYKIEIGKSPDKVVEVRGADRLDNSIVDIWDYRKCTTTKILF